MTIQDLGAIGELIGGITIIVSLVYVGYQIRQSNVQSRLLIHSNTLQHMHAPIQQFLAQPELAEIIRVGGKSPEELSENDWFKFGYYFLMQFNMYEFLYAAHLEGSTASPIWVGTDASWKNLFRQEPGVRKAWREWRHAFTDPFQGYVDSVVNASEKT